MTQDRGFRVKTLWAYTCIDENDIEGIVAMTLPGLGLTPLIGADLTRVEQYRKYAQDIATAYGLPVTLSMFSVRTDQETIKP